MNTRRSARLAPHIVGTTKVTTNALPIQGMTLMTFLGRGTNIRPFYGAGPNFQRYEFGGRHNTRNVLDSDVPVLLAMKENNKPLFAVAKVVKAPVKSIADDIKAAQKILDKDAAFLDEQNKKDNEILMAGSDTFAGIDNFVTPVEPASAKKVVKKKAASKKKPNA